MLLPGQLFVLHQKLIELEKNFEAFYIKIMRPNLNEQYDSNVRIILEIVLPSSTIQQLL